jgi:enoyl-CoA hydratase/carnithine racemase
VDFETISYSVAHSVATIRFRRPDQLNALNFAMIDEFAAALDLAEGNDAVWALVITGEGAGFCAGADLKEVLETVGVPGKRDFLDAIAAVFHQIRTLQLPVIGGLNGVTMAGGLELAMCCDVLIASDLATIGDAHSNFGVFPGAGGAAVLPERIGLNNAKYLLFTGDALPARRLMDMGLVQEVVADDELDARLQEFGEKLAAKSPLVLRRMKSVANQSMEMSQSGALQLELETLRNHFRSDDIKEGLAAFAEKRKPVFTGQ